MNNRWKMNRIGFVNFWLYDEEIFELEDGKIFFRGGNGSGKSITTQSIISFLMDGDRSPERLDSFGGKDRKMEYYLLGDGVLISEKKRREQEVKYRGNCKLPGEGCRI